MRTTAEVLGHHMESMGAGDFDGLLSDYAEDAIILTPMGVFRGTEAISGFFSGFMANLPDGFMEGFVLDVQEVDGEYAYIVWHSVDVAPLGTDTFRVVAGKIVMQTFAAYMPS